MLRGFSRHIALGSLLAAALANGTVWTDPARAGTSEPGSEASAATTPLAGEETTSSRTLVGSYLAGRVAKSQYDNASAAEFYRDALARDPSNSTLLEQAYLMEASEGNWDLAGQHAEQIIAGEPQHRMARLFLGLKEFRSGSFKKAIEHFKASGSGPIGELTSVLAIAWVKQAEGDAAGALASLDAPRQADWAQYYLRYHRALIADLAGRRQEARAAFERVFRQDSRTLRTALAYSRHAYQAGDTRLARTVLKDHLDKSQGESHPLARDLLERIEAKQRISLLVDTPTQGLAEVFYGLGEALTGEGGVSIGLLYLQMALYLEPDHAFALAALASAHETTKNYDAAITVYNRIDKTSPLQTAIEIRKALNLNSLEKVDEARDTLVKLLEQPLQATPAATPEPAAPSPAPATTAPEIGNLPTDDKPLRLGSADDRVKRLQEALKAQGFEIGEPDGKYGDETRKAVVAFQKSRGLDADGLTGPATFKAIVGADTSATATAAPAKPAAAPATKAPPVKDVQTELDVLDALGNIMRSHKRYGEAVTYYDRAIALIPKPEKRHWSYYYARGTCHERLKNWPAAEADLQKALALVPDQPLVLNYLGYSWIDQGKNLKQGMSLIEKAVQLKPDDGYIVDSLGWAHFRQGNFKEAVRYLERAVELKPDDPVLNDHLGDALWRVGREREARFQWDQALSLKPEPEDLEKIKKKLESGLEPPAQAAPDKKSNKEAAGAKAQRVTGTQPAALE